jgi:hypothetical protein
MPDQYNKTWGIPDKFWTPVAITFMTCVIGLMQATTTYMQSLTRDAVHETKTAIDETGNRAEEAAVKAENTAHKVESTLLKTTKTQAGKLDKIVKTSNDTHILVNSNMGISLKTSAVALRRVADLTGDPDDVSAAEVAEKALQEHEAKQDKVDSQP